MEQKEVTNIKVASRNNNSDRPNNNDRPRSNIVTKWKAQTKREDKRTHQNCLPSSNNNLRLEERDQSYSLSMNSLQRDIRVIRN
jgi:hypothetical protein